MVPRVPEAFQASHFVWLIRRLSIVVPTSAGLPTLLGTKRVSAVACRTVSVIEMPYSSSKSQASRRTAVVRKGGAEAVLWRRADLLAPETNEKPLQNVRMLAPPSTDMATPSLQEASQPPIPTSR